MATSLSRLLVVVFAISHLVFLNAVPVTRNEKLMHLSLLDQVLLKTQLVETTEKKFEVSRRMVVQVNDYPESGANNRHVPRTQG